MTSICYIKKSFSSIQSSSNKVTHPFSEENKQHTNPFLQSPSLFQIDSIRPATTKQSKHWIHKFLFQNRRIFSLQTSSHSEANYCCIKRYKDQVPAYEVWKAESWWLFPCVCRLKNDFEEVGIREWIVNHMWFIEGTYWVTRKHVLHLSNIAND